MKNVVKSLGYILVYFVVQFFMNVVFMMTAVLSDGLNTDTGLMNYTTERLLLITLLGNLLMVLLCAGYFKIRKRKILEEVRAVKVPFCKYLLPAGLAFAFSFVWALVTYDVTFDNSVMITSSVYFYSAAVPYLGEVLKVLALLVSAPVVEEFVCRGILIPKLEKSFSPLVAIVISAVLFGIMHLMAGGWMLAVGATLMGMVLGLIYVRTGSLWVVIVAHAFANLPDFILPLFGELNVWVRWGLTVVFAVLFVLGMVRFIKEKK